MIAFDLLMFLQTCDLRSTRFLLLDALVFVLPYIFKAFLRSAMAFENMVQELTHVKRLSILEESCSLLVILYFQLEEFFVIR